MKTSEEINFMLKKLLNKVAAASFVFSFMFAGANEFTAKAEDSPTVITDLSEEEISWILL